MNTEITKLYENEVKNIKTEIENENADTCDDKNDSFLNKRLMYIALSLMSVEIQTRALKENGFIAEKNLSRFSKDIIKLRKKYKDLFNNLLETDTSYIW